MGMLSVIREAAGKVGGVPKLARKLGVSRQAVYQWTEVPVERAADLERLTGIPRSRFRPDVFTGSAAADAGQRAPAYDHDYHGWLERQAALLAERRFNELDLDNLIDEIQALARSEKREIENRLNVLLLHLLKWVHQPAQRSGGWASTIIEQRARLLKRLQESPSLRGYPAEALDEEYAIAREKAAAETGLRAATFPKTCPYTIDQVLDPDFLP
jgi:DNA-binding transcriptional regulator YdaS (Cro superfamily)